MLGLREGSWISYLWWYLHVMEPQEPQHLPYKHEKMRVQKKNKILVLLGEWF